MTSPDDRLGGRVAVVTGASSGIGEATARRLAASGALVVLGARRTDRLAEVATSIRRAGGAAEPHVLDVASVESCERFAAEVLRSHGAVDILVNSAGLARGLAPVADFAEADWREMFEANVLGLMRVTKLFLPSLVARRGDVVHVGSIAGLQPYAGGAPYCASKAAVESFVQALRLDLAQTPIRQLVIQPGLVHTEFSEVRFHGDRERAGRVYEGLEALSADDVADCIHFALTRPAHVSIQTLLLTPTAQTSATVVHRTAS